MPSTARPRQAASETHPHRRRSTPGAGREELVDALLAASRALVAVAARSLADLAEDVTLPQYRALVELAQRGPLRAADLAQALSVDRSTATRMCERLVRKELVDRRPESTDRRAVSLTLTPAGSELVAEVTRRRRAELAKIVRRMPREGRVQALAALRAFADAAGEVPAQDWAMGWDLGS
ncbi:MAG TPA: MarR family transcriptional regulator [Solirubrobacteraceae bacterium]|nr:MarR family transcriptional regulator [Solirubrobacteraceae bacterium]